MNFFRVVMVSFIHRMNSDHLQLNNDLFLGLINRTIRAVVDRFINNGISTETTTGMGYGDHDGLF